MCIDNRWYGNLFFDVIFYFIDPGRAYCEGPQDFGVSYLFPRRCAFRLELRKVGTDGSEFCDLFAVDGPLADYRRLL